MTSKARHEEILSEFPKKYRDYSAEEINISGHRLRKDNVWHCVSELHSVESKQQGAVEWSLGNPTREGLGKQSISFISCLRPDR